MTDSSETVKIDRKALVQFVIMQAKEYADLDICKPEGVTTDDVYVAIQPREVDSVDRDDDSVVISGETIVPEVVDRKPAWGGARGEPPINPPEIITEDRPMYFTIRFTFEDLGFAEGEVEVA